MRKLIVMVWTLVLSTTVWSGEIRLNGATTFVDKVINPHKAAVEKSTGDTITIISSSTGRGLSDLLDGKCDASMAAEPLDLAVETVKLAGKSVDISKLKFHPVMTDEIVFVVNKNNPVKKLSWAQIRDIHTGKIKNWKEVGGQDMPIVVFADTVTGGTRVMIKKVVMDNQEYGPATKTQFAVKKVGDMVEVTDAGFGGLGRGFVDTSKVNIVETQKFERPLAIITIGDPKPEVAKVIHAFQAQVKK